MLACGYWGRPDLVADSFRELDGGLREFRTRDLGRLTEDGDLQHLGRADLLERIAGQYVAPSAMEASMLRHPGIREAAVVKEKSREGDTLLRAYAVASPEAEVSQASLVALLSREFPPEHLPVELRFVESFPLTATGKLDRQSLAALPPVRPALDAATEPPRGELEELVAEWWRQVLGVNHFGRNDSFFLVGGDSLRLTRVLARLSAELEVAVSPREVWPDPTIRGISELILSKVE